MPRTREETRTLFDRWAGTYDSDLAAHHDQRLGPLAGYNASLQTAVRQIPIVNHARVMDISTGAFAALLAQRGATMFGVDPSAEMLARCHQLHPAFTLRSGDFTRIPFPAERFSVVVSSFAFHEVPPGQRAAAFTEVARVLQPGGTVRLLDILSPRGEPMQLDVYVPALKLALEVDGAQHDQYNAFIYGKGQAGQKRFQYRQACDQRKEAICRQRGIRLIRIRSDRSITAESLLSLLASAGIDITPTATRD